MAQKGLIHVYHGDGKGKTTCGMGLCLRAAGAGMRVLIYQFMKDGCGNERHLLETFRNVTFASEKRSVLFSFRMDEGQKEQERVFYREELVRVFELARREACDILFLDEVLYAVSEGLLEEHVLTQCLDERPDHLEVILTGRGLSEEIRSRADYISRISKEKHPYDRGICARDGIER